MTDTNSNLLSEWGTTILTVVTSVVSTLVGAIVYLTRMIDSKYRAEQIEDRKRIDALEQEVKDCHKDKEVTAIRLARLEGANENQTKKDNYDHPKSN